MWGPAVVIVHVVHLSVCHTRMSPKLSETNLCLLGNSNRKPGFPIQNSPFWVFPGWRFAHSDRNGPVELVNVVNGSVGPVTSWHHTGHCGRLAIVTFHILFGFIADFGVSSHGTDAVHKCNSFKGTPYW